MIIVQKKKVENKINECKRFEPFRYCIQNRKLKSPNLRFNFKFISKVYFKIRILF